MTLGILIFISSYNKTGKKWLIDLNAVFKDEKIDGTYGTGIEIRSGICT